jgi:hypothetical protein
MRFLERLDHQPPRSNSGAPSGPSDELGGLRSEANRLLEAGDEAIRNALSAGNSQAFLRAGRQQGGQ